MNKKELKLVKVENKLYLISLTDEIKSENLCIFSIFGKLVEAYPEDLLGDGIEWVGKVVVYPPNIGLSADGEGFYIPIYKEIIERILNNNGKCFIEMDVAGEYKKPRIIANKVIIYE